MARAPRIYTRAGDEGRTRLAGGEEVSKTHPRIVAYGTIDELNASVGLVRVALEAEGEGEMWKLLGSFALEAQRRLFEVGCELACPDASSSDGIPSIDEDAVRRLESEIDSLSEGTPPLRAFLLPGCSPAEAAFHHARTVCRRTEREVLALHEEIPVRGEILRYLNRLSDYLFVAARAASRAAGVQETTWTP